jgi:hypothetical protein
MPAMPFRFKYKDDRERVADTMEDIKIIDTIPFGFALDDNCMRSRDKKKEIAHATMRLKSVTEVDRMNELYADDLKILDCEIMRKHPKKRLTEP